MDVFEQFATDESLEDNGAWHPLGGGVRLLVARAGNRRYGKALMAAVERNSDVLDAKDDAADKKSDEILIDVMANTILLGWDGPMTFKKVPIEYSVANAKTLLGIKDFRKKVNGLSELFDAYKVKLEEDQGKA